MVLAWNLEQCREGSSISVNSMSYPFRNLSNISIRIALKSYETGLYMLIYQNNCNVFSLCSEFVECGLDS
jgi:hypothetical protein